MPQHECRRPAIRNPNYQGPFGNTLLHSAVVSRDIQEVQRLLSAGADPTIRNRDGHTPLKVAVILDYPEVYDLLATQTDEHLEQLLDQALEATFPASDPIAVTPRVISLAEARRLRSAP